MSFLRDTDTCSAYLKGNQRVRNRFIQHGGGLFISTITLSELYAWGLRAKAPATRLQALLDLLRDVTVLELSHDVARRFGELRADQLDRGSPSPVLDLMIASTALVHGLTLITHNVVDFARISGLSVDDWIT